MSKKSRYSQEFIKARTALEKKFEKVRQETPELSLTPTKRILRFPNYAGPIFKINIGTTKTDLHRVYDPEFSVFNDAVTKEFPHSH